MNATNNQTRLDAATLGRVVEEFIDKSLAPNKRSRVTAVNPCGAANFEPGRPSQELQVTFDVIDR